MPTTQKIVIIGGGYAGLLAAFRLAPTPNISITLINARATFVQRIRLHQQLAGQTPRQYPLATLLRGKNIQLLVGNVTRLDPTQKMLEVQVGDAAQTLQYGKLIYAAGSIVNKNMVPGGRDHAFTLEMQSVAQLASQLPEITQRNGKVLVLGGGLTGIEVVTELAESYPGLQMSLVTRGNIGEGLSGKGRVYIRQTLADMGVTLVEQTGIRAVQANGILTETGDFVAADACLWTGGFTAAPLARESGLLVNAQGQIIMDETLRSISHPDIFAAGDSAAFAPETGLKMRMACATAMPMGVVAADNVRAIVAGKAPKPMNFGYLLQCMSLGRKRGLVQFVNPDDTPQDRIITGQSAAFVKEAICRYTVLSLFLERRLPGSYFVTKGKTAQSPLIALPQM